MKAFEKFIWASISVSSSQLKNATQPATCKSHGACDRNACFRQANLRSYHPGKQSPP